MQRTLRDLVDRLREAGVHLALVGGLAVSAHTEPRFTRDVDLAVAVADDTAAEEVVRRLVPPYVLLASLEHDSLERLAAVRLGSEPGHETAVADLLFASSGIEQELTDDAEALEVFPGLIVPVARIGHLLALKLLSREAQRPQDDVDLVALLGVADGEERARATDALHRIVQRGTHRGRDLLAAWEELVNAHHRGDTAAGADG
ncbi:hypothetical protein ER308_02025 [Egibacter rhizosphaerae]|uniref:Nucleotidyl transferase AbiEii/AbiGii toxin family protein n=1 Tax=Egibacter rhizosphaerae TaxID=1670831 RepID=A0A411YKY7_9ACTN|nr:hypothetical protein ER308_02025 [Egibacter rhizosphaerae]